MKILIVCSNGLSTNVLRFRLQQYAQENFLNDSFEACGLNRYHDYKDIDIICIAPQIKYFEADIRKFAKKHDISVIMLNEEDISLMKVDKIYALIKQFNGQTKKDNNDKKATDFNVFISFLLLYLISISLCYVLHINSFFSDYQLIVLIYYLTLYLSYHFGKQLNINGCTVVLLSITLTTIYISLPAFSSIFFLKDNFINILNIHTILFLLLDIFITYFVLIIYNKIHYIIRINFFPTWIDKNSIIINSLPITCIMILALMIRQIILSIFS